VILDRIPHEPTGRNDWTKAIIGQFARNWG
jgi:hypothetical protein